MKIRKGKIVDLKPLMKFLNETEELQIGDKNDAYSIEWVKSSLTDKDRNLVLISEENNKIVGFLIAEIWAGKKYSFLLDIFVIPEYRKEGVASKMIKEYERICNKLDLRKIFMLVLTDNLKMHNFSEKLNFERGNKFYFYQKRLK